MNGGNIIAQILREEGVRFLFTLCGGHISPILVGCKKEGIRVIDVRDEASAVFAADAAARMTGIPGVAAVTAGPGVTNSMTALVNARMAQSPLVLLGGSAATVLKGRGSLQDIDQIGLVQSAVKKHFAIRKNCDIMPILENAFNIARSGVPGPVFVECPIDLLYEEELVREWYGAKSGETSGSGIRGRLFHLYLKRHVDRMYACDFKTMRPGKSAASEGGFSLRQIRKAGRFISRAERPLMIVGSQAMLHPDDADRLADALRIIGVPVYLTGMARGLLGSNDPLQFRHKRKAALREADLVILAGIPCDFRLDYGRDINPKAKLISVNRSRADLYLNRRVYMNRRPDLPVHADPFIFLCLMSETSDKAPIRNNWLDALGARESGREAEIIAMSREPGEYINPVVLLRKIAERINENAIIVADGGDFVATASYVVRPAAPLSWLDPGVFGTLGVGAGFAMGAALCRPGKEVWILYGDGAAGYSLQEFDTFARHGIPVIAVIGNDACWSQIFRDQVLYLKDPVGTALEYSEYQKVAEAYGGAGFVITGEEQIDAVLDEAQAAARSGKPVIVNAFIGKSDFRKGSVSM
jgi:thiamine pyrophosphate-dependent acetolactate synthase large subunit-like protein